MWEQLMKNQVLVSSVTGWVVAQLLKTIIDCMLNKSFSPERLVGSGGMPSSHSSTVCALVVSSGLCFGVSSFEFAVSFILAAIVMYDATGVRRETGKQAKLLNMIMEQDIFKLNMEQFQEKGEEVKNISMISFSHDTLVLRKDVTDSIAISETIKKYQNDNPYNYYMVLEDGYLIVYKQDKTTVFLETGIREDELDETDRAQLLQGVGVKNISELYRYLEGYTS